MTRMITRKFAVFDCEDAPKWKGHEKLYTETFGGAKATWDIFKCWDGELPGLEAAEQFVGIFITGSHFSAYEDMPWISALMTWLHDFLQREHSTRIVAVCFGSQVAARALGGRVGKNPSQRFVLTVEDLQLTEAFAQKDYFRAAFEQQTGGQEPPASLKIIESHGDQVLELPEAAQLLATSATAPNEVWTVGDRLLAIQGHPEMAPQEALSKIHATLASNGRLSEEEAAASRAALEGTPPDSAAIQRIMEAFVEQGAASDTPLPPPEEVRAGKKPEEGTTPETGTSYGLTGWLPSVTMPAVSLPSLALPAWMPRPGLATSASSAPPGHDSSAPQETSAQPAEAAALLDTATTATQAADSVQISADPEGKSQGDILPGSGAPTGGRPEAGKHLPESSAAEASGSGTPLDVRPGPSMPLQESEAASSCAADRAAARRAKLHAQAERLVDDMAGAVSAELDGAVANYELLFGVNTVSRAEFLHMQQELANWQPLMQARTCSSFEIQRKREACRPLLAALEGLEARMESVEGNIATLDADTRHLARQLGVPPDA
ncbi:hypothetical protein COCSUDRAFT_83672 [Coccomyxa subellipsoidea C-169]|uniref:Glutamine amidotransferase domain-containing protein n=1 Tax=Coccomyxa subellipsoidea (strain C-169) TaxID=574566 RepID=I0Z149_COCSC|nr:hypothetical protein COCSUDRAFT_83672 [Coccomyxa subellipsoidea C-169]EIE24368.1 hypothetical protein COCSUDRAFT_83672 [Coccomyxa subellipsoidea C-169]|eukprot:XP_005648912.1 hypothetical protein COCSUDRAFT_83672 [Coccomyxa subellipsoidea C-169]